MTKQRKGRMQTKVRCTRSPVDNATVSTLGKLEESSAPGWKNTESSKQNGMTNHCLKNTEMMRDTPVKQQKENSEHSTQILSPEGGNLGAIGNCEDEKGKKTSPHQQRNQIRKRETIWIGHRQNKRNILNQ